MFASGIRPSAFSRSDYRIPTTFSELKPKPSGPIARAFGAKARAFGAEARAFGAKAPAFGAKALVFDPD